MKLPAKGEYWEVVDGQGKGAMVKIIDTPEVTPIQRPYVLVEVDGKRGDPRSLPLDERWGSTIVKAEGFGPNDEEERRAQQARDRLTRVGLTFYGVDDPAAAYRAIFEDFMAIEGAAKVEQVYRELGLEV